jgi:hypothetical protein
MSVGWIDVLKVGEIKISARGLHIGPNVHHTDEKLKDLPLASANRSSADADAP